MFGSVSSFFYRRLMGVRPLAAGYDLIGVHPTGIGASNLTSGAASVWTPHGEASAQWELSSSDPTCAKVDEGGTAHLGCTDPTDRMAAVEFASYGTPSGTCGVGGGAPTFARDASCGLHSTAAKVAAVCVGKPSCEVDASNDFFGTDPCVGKVKSLAVKVRCAQKAGAAYTLRVSIPPGAAGRVAVVSAANATITEGGAAVWAAGKFVPGVPGVSGATALGGAEPAVEFNVSSGSFRFVAAAA